MNVCSIFNEVLGPVMYGPSSSHSAAPCRIGYICQSLLNVPLLNARVCFDNRTSYASTYKFHCTDRGFTAGLLGIKVNDEQNRRAFEIARERGVSISFHIEAQKNTHPNYALLYMEGEGDHLTVGTLSTGGGAFEIISVDEFPLSITGDSWYTLVKNPICDPVIDNAEISWSECGNDRLLIVRSFTSDYPEVPDGEWVRRCAPELPVTALPNMSVPFNTYEEALDYGKTYGLSAGELGIVYEMARSGKSRGEVIDYMDYIMDVMHNSVYDSMNRPDGSKLFGHYPYRSKAVGENLTKLPSPMYGTALIGARASAVFEHTLSIGLVVAAPTGGSCGVLPAAVVCLGEDMGLPREKIAMGLFAAGLVGVFISNEATFGCEVAGCQAENGSGSAMAAAGIAEMLGADLQTAFDCAAIALQNTLGLVCDPIGCAYVPCVTRNAMSAVNAVSAASMVMSGFYAHVPLGETIRTMMQIGLEMPACHRCTVGGLNASETGKRLGKMDDQYARNL